MSSHRWSAVLLIVLLAFSGGHTSIRAQAPPPPDGIAALLHRLEAAVRSGVPASYLALLSDSANRSHATDFISAEFEPGVTRVVIRERDRVQRRGSLPDNGFRLTVDAFVEYSARGRVATWILDVKRVGAPGTPDEWAIEDENRISSVESLYKLSMTTNKEFAARNLTLTSEDIALTLVEGSAFVVEVDQGVTGLVLLGNGLMHFRPAPETERGQVKIFCGAETLETRFDAMYVRINPGEFKDLLSSPALRPRSVDAGDLRRAQDLFRDDSSKSFVLDLGDLSSEEWSLLPSPGDFLAEIHTRRFDTLTYARSSSEAEDVSLFDRKRRHNIALYASKEKIETRGRFYNEDDLTEYDVLDYNLDVTVLPDRQYIEGRANILLKIRADVVGTLTMKLADTLAVQSVVSTDFGRLFAVRVKGQNSLVVNLPSAIPRNKVMLFSITYAGRLEPQTPDRETLVLGQGRLGQEEVPLMVTPEANTLYSSRSFWYPQALVSDYATATLNISIPANLECVASGELQPGSPSLQPSSNPADSRKLYTFIASQPIRYLAVIISRFVRAETMTIAFPDDDREEDVPLAGTVYHSLNLAVEANPRQAARAREVSERAADIAMFYESLLGDSPYPTFTVALVENDLPGGHSPGYFAALNQPLPQSMLSWRNDPAAFSGFPEFFLAHELAHQWWGQAVGWRNYHEQWISEGFAQYFAALYARHERGDDTFASIMRQCRRWAMDESDQGPIYLGYRIGHIRGQSRIFRALIYNKSAAVLHMLRRFVGDDAFFRGLRRFYRGSRFTKAGTDSFRAAMEAESGKPLDRFFERWIYGSTLPRIKFSHHVDGREVVLVADQSTTDIFDVPLTVELQYADRKVVEVTMLVTDRHNEMRVPLAGKLKDVDISKDDGTLGDISR